MELLTLLPHERCPAWAADLASDMALSGTLAVIGLADQLAARFGVVCRQVRGKGLMVWVPARYWVKTQAAATEYLERIESQPIAIAC